jgi:hypothetical protein
MIRHTVVVAVAAALTGFAPSAHAQADPDVLSSAQAAYACALPPLTGAEPVSALRIAGSQDPAARSLFGTRDLLVVNGGTTAGLQLGQRYFTKRQVTYGIGTRTPIQAPHTTGWIRVVAVNDTTAIASVEFACDGMVVGDYLAPFVLPAVPADADRSGTPGAPDFSSPLGHVLFANEARDTGATGDFMLLDRGAREGMAPGMRLALYRDLRVDGVPLTSIGDAVIVSTTDSMSVMRIVAARDAIQTGDYVVQRK